MNAERKLKEMGLELPPPVKPVGNYVPAVRTGNLVFLSGHGPLGKDGTVVTGQLGANLTLEEGYEAARLVALGLLGSLKGQDWGKMAVLGILIIGSALLLLGVTQVYSLFNT